MPGVALGLIAVRALPQESLELAAGVLVLASGGYLLLAHRAARPAVGVSRGVTATAGACSGLLGVTTSLNGIPPAVLLARSGASVRTRLADLSAFFALGNCLTLAALAVVGDVATLAPDATTLSWLGAGLAGNAWGLRLADRLDTRRFDRLTVLLVLVSGVAAIAGVAVV